MRLRFIGSGSAFATMPNNFQSNMIFELDDPQTGDVRRLLFDCGSDARWGLAALNLDVCDIDAVYISHLHADHIGGMEWLGFKNYFCNDGRRIPLFLAEELQTPLWENSLKGGMEFLDFGKADLDTFFDVHPVDPDESFRWMGVTFHLVALPHMRAAGYISWSYGVFVETHEGGVLLTSDTRFELDRLQPWYDKATSIIFQDCETNLKCSAAHAHFDDISSLPEDIKGRMWLYHTNSPIMPDAKAAGFQGVVAAGQVFEIGNPVISK